MRVISIATFKLLPPAAADQVVGIHGSRNRRISSSNFSGFVFLDRHRSLRTIMPSLRNRSSPSRLVMRETQLPILIQPQTVGKTDTCVGDVFNGASKPARQPHVSGSQIAPGKISDVVDHKIQHDADVDTAVRER
jgi:hypothetical protein